MKGLAPAVGLVVFILVTSLAIEGIFLNNLVARFETVSRSIREIEIVEGINVLENLRTAVVTALDYSFYQGLYDVAVKGGYYSLESVQSLDCKPYWRIYSDVYFPDKFADSARILTEENFKTYQNMLQVENTVIPEYAVAMEDLGNSVKLTATAKDQQTKLTARGNFYTVTNNPNFEKVYDADVSKIYDISKSEFVESQPVQQAIVGAVEDLRNENPKCLQYEEEYCQTSAAPDCVERLDANCPNADEKYKDKIKSSVNSLSQTLSSRYSNEKVGFSVQVNDQNIVAEHETNPPQTTVVCDGKSDCGCGCNDWNCPSGTDWREDANGDGKVSNKAVDICKNCPSDAERRDVANRICWKCMDTYNTTSGGCDDLGTPEVDDGRWNTDYWASGWGGCDVYYTMLKRTCTYSYKGAASAEVTATDLSWQYAVCDKAPVMSNIKLQFLDLSSSDPTNYQPIVPQTSSCTKVSSC